ncbi:MAG: IS3 family transposase [Bacillota bacterium]
MGYGIRCSQKRVARLMQEANLVGVHRKRRHSTLNYLTPEEFEERWFNQLKLKETAWNQSTVVTTKQRQLQIAKK